MINGSCKDFFFVTACLFYKIQISNSIVFPAFFFSLWPITIINFFDEIWILISCGWDLAIIQFFKSYIMYDSRVVTFCYIVHLKTTSQTYKINQNCRLCSNFFLFGKLYILDFFRYTACIICKHKIEEWC